MLQTKRLTPEQAYQKLKQFCGYQERCHQETKEKLYSYGLYKKDVQILLSNLIEENFLNEERFSEAFAGGKFRIKNWGKKKIEYELKQKQVSSYCITKALKTIDEEEYIRTLTKLAEKKWVSLKGEHYLTRQTKTTVYLLQKGYEQKLISAIITTLLHEKNK